MVQLKQLAQTYWEVFPEIFWSCPNLPPTSYAYCSNVQTLANY